MPPLLSSSPISDYIQSHPSPFNSTYVQKRSEIFYSYSADVVETTPWAFAKSCGIAWAGSQFVSNAPAMGL